MTTAETTSTVTAHTNSTIASIPKRTPKMYAVVRTQVEGKEATCVLEAPTMNELKRQLTNIDLEVVAVFRGRQLKMEEKRQVTFSA